MIVQIKFKINVNPVQIMAKNVKKTFFFLLNFYCKDFAPHIKHECSSIVLIRHFSETRVKLFGMTVYGLYNINGEMIILPLRNLH